MFFLHHKQYSPTHHHHHHLITVCAPNGLWYVISHYRKLDYPNGILHTLRELPEGDIFMLPWKPPLHAQSGWARTQRETQTETDNRTFSEKESTFVCGAGTTWSQIMSGWQLRSVVVNRLSGTGSLFNFISCTFHSQLPNHQFLWF